jgi:hypothetical protein
VLRAARDLDRAEITSTGVTNVYRDATSSTADALKTAKHVRQKVEK